MNKTEYSEQVKVFVDERNAKVFAESITSEQGKRACVVEVGNPKYPRLLKYHEVISEGAISNGKEFNVDVLNALINNGPLNKEIFNDRAGVEVW